MNAQDSNKSEPEAMTVRNFAALIGAGESTAWKLISQKRVRAVKIGRSTRVLRSDAASFLASLPTIGEAA